MLDQRVFSRMLDASNGCRSLQVGRQSERQIIARLQIQGKVSDRVELIWHVHSLDMAYSVAAGIKAQPAKGGNGIPDF